MIDSESRDLPRREALRRLRDFVPALAAADVAFKKVDSLLRGNTVPEIVACARGGAFRSVIVAPAFPRQLRITRDGQQFACTRAESPWLPVGPNLLHAFAAAPAGRRAVGVRHVARGMRPRGHGIFVCDAETDQDLSCLARQCLDLEPPLLWCGTAGLAHALNGRARRLRPRSKALLMIVASRHRATELQVRDVSRRWPAAVVRVTPGSKTSKVAATLCAGLIEKGFAALVPRYPDLPAADAETRLRGLLDSTLRSLPRPDLLFVIGGATLRMTLDAVSAEHVRVDGEVAPGIAVARILGGAWDGLRLVSRSGAFGDPTSLTLLLARIRVQEST